MYMIIDIFSKPVTAAVAILVTTAIAMPSIASALSLF